MRGLLAGALLVMVLSGCAVQTAALKADWPAGLPNRVELNSVPFFAQTAFHCGPAALATAVGAIGIVAAPEAVAERIFLPARQGTLQVEMIAGVRREGAVATRIPGSLESLLREVAAGHSVVVLQNLGLKIAPTWHYAVVVGFDRDEDEIILRSGVTRRERMPIRTFEHTWARAGSWGFVALPPGRWPVTATAAAAAEAAVGFERSAPAARAMAVYASAVQHWPSEPVLAVGLGNTAFASGQLVLAADTFSHAARQFGSVPAGINLARTLIESGHPAAALEAAQQAAAAQSDATWAGPLGEVTAEAQLAVARQSARSPEMHRHVTAGSARHLPPDTAR